MLLKKIIIYTACLISSNVFAQTGAMEFKNTSLCTVNITVAAQDVYDGYNQCALVSNLVSVPPGAIYEYSTVAIFQSTVGWSQPTSSYSLVTTGSTNFMWNASAFQFVCPAGSGCTDEGTTVNNVLYIVQAPTRHGRVYAIPANFCLQGVPLPIPMLQYGLIRALLLI